MINIFKTNQRVSFLIYLTSLTLILATVSCKQKPQAPPSGPRPYPVVEVKQQNVTAYNIYPTSIEGRNNNDVRAKISGYIKQVLVDEGQQVSRGQILFRLETNLLSENAAAARSGISAAQANVSAAQASVNTAQVEVDKLLPLVEKKIISNVQLETAKANLERAKAQLSQARAAVGQARANYNSASANVEYSVIRSPINGVVGKLPLKVGSLVGPNDAVALTTVSDVNELFAYFSMNESAYLNFLNTVPGKNVSEKLKSIPPVELELANGELYNEKGKVEAVTGQIDPQTGTVLFRASFPNKEKLLSNGYSGKVRIPIYYDSVMVVPESSTFEQQGIVSVFKVQQDSVISNVIKVKDRVNNLAIVESGISTGDKIIAAGIGGLKTGNKIIPRPVSFDSIVQSVKPIF